MSLNEEFHQQGEFEDYEGEPTGRSTRAIWGTRIAGLVAAFVVWLLLGTSEGLSPDARFVAAIGTLMAIW